MCPVASGFALRRTLEGIVVQRRDFGDAHRIVELLSADEGRISVLARAGRKSRRRFPGALDLFVTLRGQMVASGNLWTLSSAEVVAPRLQIRNRLDAFARASQLVELARYLAPERQEAHALVAVLNDALDRIAGGDVVSATLAYPALLKVAGILPDTAKCARCGSAQEGGRVIAHEFVCSRCHAGGDPWPRGVLDVWAGGLPEDEKVADAVEASILIYVQHSHQVRFKSRVLAGHHG